MSHRTPGAGGLEIELAGWRREVATLYAAVRQAPDPEAGHALWRAGRDRLFQTHPQSPLGSADPLRAGLPYAPYEPGLRFELAIEPRPAQRISIATGQEETSHLRLLGHVSVPEPIGAPIAVWWLEQYGGGLFVPLRDGTAGTTSYGGGRYLLDSAKGADLGDRDGRLIIDLNFLYHPSCRYDPQWQCPLAPRANVVSAPIHAGEQS